MISLPKSGSHLIGKLIRKVSSNPFKSLGKDVFCEDGGVFPPHQYATPENFLKLFQSDSHISLMGHFNFSQLFRIYAEHHPACAKIIMIRDLRDVCDSTAFFIKDFLDSVLGPDASFDRRLLYVIAGNTPPMDTLVFNVQKQANEALEWMHDPSVVVCHFEDLVGENGRGTEKRQIQQIQAIVDALGISLTPSEMDELADSL
jgi:hypothetical protein